EGVELRHEAAHVAQLRQLLGEHLVDAGRTGLGAQRPQALGEQARGIGLALGDYEVAGAEMGIALVLGPGGVQLRPPAVESRTDVQAFEDVVPSGRFHPPLVAPRAASWKGPPRHAAHTKSRVSTHPRVARKARISLRAASPATDATSGRRGRSPSAAGGTTGAPWMTLPSRPAWTSRTCGGCLPRPRSARRSAPPGAPRP